MLTQLPTKERRTFEIMLVVVTIGITYLLFCMGAYKMVVLNLFFLPIVLSGYFLGRTSAGVLALFSVLSVTLATSIDFSGFAAYNDPIMVGLAITVWGGTLGLTAILVGTLCEERARTVEELHAAYVGVVEVLSKYLQSANPKVKARSARIAELSQSVAEELKLPRKEIDDIRVGSLLFDLGNIEITTQLLSRAVDTLEATAGKRSTYTFSGTELVHSLSTVLSGAMPLLLTQDDAVRECLAAERGDSDSGVPLGAKVIRSVRAIDALTSGEDGPRVLPERAVQELRKDISGGFDPEVLDAIERVLRRSNKPAPAVPAYA